MLYGGEEGPREQSSLIGLATIATQTCHWYNLAGLYFPSEGRLAETSITYL